MSRLSFNKLIKNFYIILIAIVLVAISFTIISSFKVRLKQAKLKSEQSNLKHIESLIHEVKKQYEITVTELELSDKHLHLNEKNTRGKKIQQNLYSLLLELLNKLTIDKSGFPDQISLDNSNSLTTYEQLDQIVRLVQLHNQSINHELNRKFLHKNEFQRLIRRLEHNKTNKYQTPLRLNIYQINEFQHKKLVKRFHKLSNEKGWNVSFEGNYADRSITLNRADANYLDKLDGTLDGEYQLSTKLRSSSLLTIYVERMTWSLPNSKDEREQTLLNKDFKSRNDIDQRVIDQIEVETPMILIASYLLSKQTFFGESSHPFFGGAELFVKQLRNYEKGIDTNQLMFHTATFPPNINIFNTQSDTVYIFPRNAIVLMFDKRWLIRSIASNLLESQQLKNVIFEFDNKQINKNFYKLKANGEAMAFNKKEVKYFLKQQNKVSWNKGTPLHSKELVNNENCVFTSKVVRLGPKLNFRIHLWQPLNKFNKTLYLDYGLVSLALLLIIWLSNIIRIDWSRLRNDMQACINLIVSGIGTIKSEPRNELQLLAQSIGLFNRQIKMRKEFTLLKRRILHVINMPRLEPNQYLEELQYACRDTSERFNFNLMSQDQSDPYTLKIKIGNSWQQDLKMSEPILQFKFKGPLRDLEIDQLNHDLQILIQRAEIQSHLRKADQLGADLELSKKLQKVLDPVMEDNESLPEPIEIESILVRTNQMQFDAMDKIVNDNMISIYHIDLNDRGLSSALLSTSFKSSLHSLLQLEISPADTLLEFNKMILAQEITNLFVSCAILQIDLNNQTLNFSSAGHAGLWQKVNNDYQCLHREGIPLGIKSNPNIETWSKPVEKGDYCIFNNSVHFSQKLPEQNIYNQEKDLKTIAHDISASAKNNNLDFDFCAWLIRIL